MKLFVTGSTGLLGTNLVHEALDRGWTVRALARSLSKAEQVLPRSNRLEIVTGDLESIEHWSPQLQGCDALVHGAAFFREYFSRGDHANPLRRLNVELPVKLWREAKAHRVDHVVMISSSGVLGPPAAGEFADESTPPSGIAFKNLYFRSKVEMERALGDVEPPDRLCIVRPGWMFGPHDSAPTAAGAFARELVQGKKVVFPQAELFGIVDARDVAWSIAEAVERRASGVFNLTGHNMSALEALKEIAKATPSGRVQAVPIGFALTLGHVLEVVTRLLGKPNPVSVEGIKTLAGGIPVSTAKAERELGTRWRPFSETARDTVADLMAKKVAEKV